MREKTLSLTERLRREFGLSDDEDKEEEKGIYQAQTSCYPPPHVVGEGHGIGLLFSYVR